MHMSDALLSPAVGGAMWTATGATMAWSAAKMRRQADSGIVPLMGVLAAFVFAGQMINFTIPGTGSSGHLGGGIILAALLGAPSAFLAMASILTVQALLFADGGLLALGCNIFNLGFFPAFVAYPLLFRPLAGRTPTPARLTAASMAAALLGLQLGALGVIVQTTLSRVSDLPLPSFAALMLPIHLAIGVAEGLATAAVVSFVWRVRPELLANVCEEKVGGTPSAGRVLATLSATALIAAAVLTWFASTRPDGLEWSIEKATKGRELTSPSGRIHTALEGLQENTALLPGYGFPGGGAGEAARDGEATWPPPPTGTSLSGLVGGVLTLLLAAGIALVFRRRTAGGREA